MKKCTWNGKEYDSISEAARANNVTPWTMHYRVKKGYTCDNDIFRKNRAITWNGKEYDSITEAAKEHGISRQAMHKRIEAGHTCDDDLRGQ